MLELIKYSLHDYVRSHKYFAPISTYIILIIVFYTYKPNPVLDSYAVTASMLYVVSAWLCISVLALDAPVQRQLFIKHIGSMNRYYVSKLISVFFIAIILTIFTFIYPIIFQMFNDTVTPMIGTVAIINHIVLSVLGISIASLFSNAITDSAVNSYGGLALVIVISIASLGIYNILPAYVKYIVWIIPPAIHTHKTLIDWNGISISELSLFPFIWIILYALLLIYLFLTLAKRLNK